MNRADLDPLFDEALQAACYFLEKNGEFFPFGVVLRSDGERRHVQGWTKSEQPPPAEVIDAAQSNLGMAGTARADAVKASLLRNLDILEKLGCLDPAGMAKLATGNAPTNPLSPALRSGPAAVSGAVREKQIH